MWNRPFVPALTNPLRLWPPGGARPTSPGAAELGVPQTQVGHLLAAGKEACLWEPVKSEICLALPQALLLFLPGDWLKRKSLSLTTVKQDMQEMECRLQQNSM